MVAGVGTRGGHSPRDLIMQTDDLLTWVPPSPTRVKKSSRRRAPDAERGCPPATVVVRASSPSSPEAGAAPRRPSVSQPASDGRLAAVWPQWLPSASRCSHAARSLHLTQAAAFRV